MAALPPRIIEGAMDSLRPGWRKRRAGRRSAWNLLCVLVGVGLMCVLWFGLFHGMWRLHVHFFPEHRPYERQFWGSGISPGAFASSFLMLMPLALPATVLGFLAANC